MKSWESFFFTTLTDINPGFGRPWKKLWIFFVNGTFIMPQKKSFGQKNFWISCTGSKVPFWQFFHSAKMALLSRLQYINFSCKVYSKFWFICYPVNPVFWLKIWLIRYSQSPSSKILQSALLMKQKLKFDLVRKFRFYEYHLVFITVSSSI